MEVQILSRKLVTPSSPTPQHLRSFNISGMDQAEPLFVYPSHIFYYHNSDFRRNIVNGKLEKSLSDLLTIYYPLAGRFLDQEKDIITCNDQGAEYVLARVLNIHSLAQFQLHSESDVKLCNLLSPELPIAEPATWPVLLFQVSLFDCGGVAIAVNLPHRVADAYSVDLFINGWATATRLRVSQVVPPSLDLPSLFPLRLRGDPNLIRPSGFKIEPGAVFVNKRVVFNKTAIQSLRDHVIKNRGDERRRAPSPWAVVAAFIWRSYIRAAEAKHGHLRPSWLYIPVSLRGKTSREVPIPDNCFGNLFSYAFARFVSAGQQPELAQLVAVLEAAVKKAVMRCTEQESREEVFAMVAEANRERGEGLGRSGDGVDVYGLSSLCGFAFEEVDFGWGKPTWVSFVSIPVPLTRLISAADGEGIEAWVSLQEDEMLLFEQDQLVLPLIEQHRALLLNAATFPRKMLPAKY